MTDRHDFEHRLEARLRAHADRAARPFDAAGLASEAATASGRRRSLGRHWWQGLTDEPGLRVAAVGFLLLVAFATGTILVGAAFRNRAPLPDPRAVIVAPTSTPTRPPVADTDPTAVPTPTPAVLQSSPNPSLTAAGVGVGPCAAMVQLLEGWAINDPDPPVTLKPTSEHDDGYILLGTAGAIAVVDGSSGVPAAPVRDSDGLIAATPGYENIPIANGGGFLPAPNGMAIAIEEGDLGVAGCGDPLVKFAQGGLMHPFSARAFQTVTDLAWAHDGSALYGILRPTIDAAGKPLVAAPEDAEGFPGTVLRWEVASREVTDLGTPCPTCRLNDLAVSPDGHVVVNTADRGASVREPDGSWRDIGEMQKDFGGQKLIGWTPDGLMVVENYEHIDMVDLQGRLVTTSGRICCHGNGYGGLLSPDGTQVAGSTLSSDFRSREIVLVDVRDGSQRTVAGMPNLNAVGIKVPSTPSTAPRVPFGAIVAWAPDGKSLLMLDAGPDRARLWSLSLDTLVASDPIGIPATVPPTPVWLPKVP